MSCCSHREFGFWVDGKGVHAAYYDCPGEPDQANLIVRAQRSNCMRTMYWMTHDLRLDDNPALRLAAQSSELAVVTVVNPDRFIEGRYGLALMGERRWQFLQQALADG